MREAVHSVVAAAGLCPMARGNAIHSGRAGVSSVGAVHHPRLLPRAAQKGWLCWFSLTTLVALVVSGCSIKKMAVNRLGDALARGGTTVNSDNDPELIKSAVPFSLKLMESLLNESPNHRGLLLATASGFTQYSYAFVQQEADETEENDFTAATNLRLRARKLYIRARNYGLRGLATKHPNCEKQLRENPKAAVALMTKADVPLLYWTAASWAAAISNAKDDPDLIADLPSVEAMMDRSLQLDEGFNLGAIHNFLITYEMTRQKGEGDRMARAKRHFERALALSGGKLAAPLVTYAEAVCIPKGDRAEFEKVLNRALAIDPDTLLDHRLANLIMQRRARWLLSRVDTYFISKDKQQ